MCGYRQGQFIVSYVLCLSIPDTVHFSHMQLHNKLASDCIVYDLRASPHEKNHNYRTGQYVDRGPSCPPSYSKTVKLLSNYPHPFIFGHVLPFLHLNYRDVPEIKWIKFIVEVTTFHYRDVELGTITKHSVYGSTVKLRFKTTSLLRPPF